MAGRSEKRALILDAAIRVFARHGYHQSRVADVAREAGVADGTIYLYFHHKEDILIAIFEEKMAEVTSLLKKELQLLPDPLGKIQHFIQFHLSQMEQNQELAEVLQVELRLSNKFMKEYVPVRLTEYLDLLAEIISEGQRTGQFRPDLNPNILKRAIFGALDELAMHWVLTKGRRPDLSAAIQQLSDVFMRGMCSSEKARHTGIVMVTKNSDPHTPGQEEKYENRNSDKTSARF